ncbi:glycerate kinase family protein [Agathobacter sp.]|uniref:glycerate kinase family protein n=1 Tax=Agathobacter sp. TaxID=2021311 RepID=UPI003FD8A19B
MKFLFASDSFKGSLSSEKIIEILTQAAKNIFPDCETNGVPVADGGEGTVDAVVAATNGTMEKVCVHGPLMEKVEASYGRIHGNGAIIEMAAASGLPLVPTEKRNPLYTTTLGTGEMIADALNKGYRDISIAIGGSATNDGGMGAMIALGVKFLDKDGVELKGFGEDLEKVASIDMSGIHPAVAETKFTVMCDVNNPLTGEDGATYTFGAQKGADEEVLTRLEKGMKNYAQVIQDTTGIDVDTIPGTGAAGGLGAALKVFLNANLKSGIETVLDLIEFDSLLEGADLVITGEGRMDWQSAFGKVPSGVGLRSKAKNIPVFAIVGGMGKGVQNIYDYGVDSIITTVNGPMPLEEAMERAEELYADVADRLFRIVKAMSCK